MIAGLQNFLFIPQDAEIIRTRDPAQLAECDIVVDVGGEFDPKRHRYDHHQRYSLRKEIKFITFLISIDVVNILSKTGENMNTITCYGNHIVCLF